MPMRTECAHYRSRTYANGETVSTCELNLAPEAPWRCPAGCRSFEARIQDPTWEGVSLIESRPPDEPSDLAAAAVLLGEAEGILNAVGPEISKELDAQRQRQERRDQRRGRRRARRGRIRHAAWGRTVRVGLLLALLGGIVFVAVRPSVLQGVPVIGPKKTVSSVAAPNNINGWDPEVWPVVQFVEHERGLNFTHTVPIRFLAEDAFARVAGRDNRLTAAQVAQVRDDVATMRALGLVQGDVDLATSQDFVTQDLLGFYSFDKKELYVRGTKLTADVRVTLAHELTHALDDQHFGLKRGLTSSGAEEAFQALSEGNAVRVQTAYLDTLPLTDKTQYAQSQNELRPDHPDVPEVFSDALSFPYQFGPTFIQALLDHEGNAAVDQAFRNPPVSQAEIVDPSIYLAHRKPVKVAPPALGPGQTRIDKPDDFGQVLTVLVLGDRLDYGTAWSAVQGWAGDSAVSYHQDGRVCVAVATASGTPADADRLLAATQRWAAAVPGATVARTADTVELRSCDPGKGAPAHATAKPSAFRVLAIRAAIVRQLREHSHMPQPVAECTADEVITRIGPGPLVGFDETGGDVPDTDPRVVQIHKASTQAATACFARA